MTNESGAGRSRVETTKPEAGDSRLRLQELSQRLRGLGGTTDQELEDYLRGNAKQILGTVLAVLLLVWMVSEFRSASKKRTWESAEIFNEVQSSYSKAEAKNEEAAAAKGEANEPAADKPKEIAEDETARETNAFAQSAKTLVERSGAGVYGDLSRIYLAAAAVRRGEGGRSAAETVEPILPKKGNPAGIVERSKIDGSTVASELAALLDGRALLNGTADEQKAGKERLIGLVRNGQFVNGEALVALARTAGESDRAEVQSLFNDLVGARPELIETVEKELSVLGYKRPD